METVETCRTQRSALLQQVRALRAAIPRQTSTAVADLMRLILGVAGERQPQTCHSLAECTGIQKPLDKAVIGVWRTVREKEFDLGRCGGADRSNPE